jgi:hypothetical protein
MVGALGFIDNTMGEAVTSFCQKLLILIQNLVNIG